jgi:exportin-1
MTGGVLIACSLTVLTPQAEAQPLLMEALHYMLMISEVDDNEIFKICLEYWNFITSSLYHERCK